MWQQLIAPIGGLIGTALTSSSQRKAAAATQEALNAQREIIALQAENSKRLMDYFGNQTPPNLINLIPQLEEMVIAGQLTPEQAAAHLADESAAAGVRAPQELVDAQFASLRQMQDIATQGGLTAMDKAQLEEIRAQVAGEERAARQAIMQNAAERGVAGSGLEMAQRLISQQGAAERSSKMGTDVAALAQQRALQAMAQSGTLAGSMRSADVEEQMNRARAIDAINQFNVNVRNQTEQANVAARNAAQAANLQNAQNISNANVALRNERSMLPIQLQQQQFSNQQDINKNLLAAFGAGSTATSNATQGMGTIGQLAINQQTATNNANKDMMNSILGGLQGWAQTQKPSGGTPTSGTGGGTPIQSHIESKKEVSLMSDEEARAIMDSIIPRKFKYKNEADGPGKWAGVVIEEMGPAAQEVLLVDTPEGSGIDQKKAISAALAGLANLNDRISRIEGVK